MKNQEPGIQTGRRFHPAMSRRIAAESPDLMLRLHACWQMAADQTERLEETLRRLAASRGDAGVGGAVLAQSGARELAMLAAADALREARTLMAAYVPVERSGDSLSPIMVRLLLSVSELLETLARDANAR